MISGVRGTLEKAGLDWVIIAVGGISLQVFVPTPFINDLGSIGSRIHLHTHLVVKEGSWALYGFASPEALQLFGLLIGVSGVGPKFGLALLSGLNPADLSVAITTGDSQSLTRVPGIGKRTAERIVVELKDKLDSNVSFSSLHQSAKYEDASQALATLGYSSPEIRLALASITEIQSLSVEEQIRLALDYFSSH